MNLNENYSDNCSHCEAWKAEEIAFDTGADADVIISEFGMCKDCQAEEQSEN
jgi:hypothetical protein